MIVKLNEFCSGCGERFIVDTHNVNQNEQEQILSYCPDCGRYHTVVDVDEYLYLHHMEQRLQSAINDKAIQYHKKELFIKRFQAEIRELVKNHTERMKAIDALIDDDNEIIKEYV